MLVVRDRLEFDVYARARMPTGRNDTVENTDAGVPTVLTMDDGCEGLVASDDLIAGIDLPDLIASDLNEAENFPFECGVNILNIATRDAFHVSAGGHPFRKCNHDLRLFRRLGG